MVATDAKTSEGCNMTVTPLHPNEPAGALLCTIQLWRRPDGSIQSVIVCMDGGMIETTGDCVGTRVAIVADWMHEGADDLDQQSEDWLKGLEPPA